MGRYLTSEAIRLGLVGLGTGSAAGLAWRIAGRGRWGASPVLLTILAATRLAGRSDWPRWDAVVLAAAGFTLLGAAGTARLLADPAVGHSWVLAGAVISVAGVWGGVPETGPALLVGGGLSGLAATAALTRARWAPAAGLGVAVAVGWAALSGAAGRPWAVVGGTLCAGVAPWFALRPLLPTLSWSRCPGPWLLGAHTVLVMLAARWIGVVPQAGWHRVAVVATVGLAVALATRRKP